MLREVSMARTVGGSIDVEMAEKQPMSFASEQSFLLIWCFAEDYHYLPMLFRGDLVAYGPEGGKLESLSDILHIGMLELRSTATCTTMKVPLNGCRCVQKFK